MAARVVGAAVLSAIAMFFWGFLYWGVLNMTTRIMAPLPREADVLAPLRAEGAVDNVYIYPGPLAKPGDAAATAEWEKKMNDGPLIQLVYREKGMSPMEPTMFAKGLALNFVVALLAAVLLAAAAPALPTFGARFRVLALLAVIAALWANGDNVIWWFHSLRYSGGQMLYQLVAGLLMALVTAAIVRTPSNQRVTAPM